MRPTPRAVDSRRPIVTDVQWHAGHVQTHSIPQRPAITIRSYRPSDAADTLAIFLAAVTETAAADYTAEQIRAWARPQDREIATWHTAMQARNTYIATIDGAAAGFSDVDGQGYIDMMFVAPAYLRRGVAQQLLRYIEEFAQSEGMSELTANVSITARRFFAHHGFVVQAEQHPVMLGVQLTNYAMKKNLLSD